jgi:hypothetical protein
VALPDGTHFSHEGVAWVAESGEDKRLSFTFETSPLLKSKLSFDVAVVGRAFIDVTCNSESVFSRAIGADKLTLESFTIDITPFAERMRVSKITIEAHLPTSDSPGTKSLIIIPKHSYAVQQIWDISYTLPALSYFTSIAILILALAVWLGGLASSAAILLGALVVVTTAFGFVWELLELPKSFGLAVIRRLYATLPNWRRSLALLVAAAAALCTWQAYRVVDVLLARYSYTRMVQKVITGSPSETLLLQQAFVEFPWRREAQVLLERDAFQLRTTIPDTIRRKILRSWITQPDVVAAAQRPLQDFHQYLKGETSEFSDPAILYTQLRMEASIPEDIPVALRKSEWEQVLNDCDLALRGHDGSEIKVQRCLIALSRSGAKTQEFIRPLNDLLSSADLYFLRSFLYQHGADMLAGCYLFRARDRMLVCQTICSESDRDAISLDLDQTRTWYGNVIKQRAKILKVNSGAVAWLRPPQKLEVFHILTAAKDDESAGGKIARSRLARYDECRCFAARVDSNCAKDQLKAELIADYPDYAKITKWSEGTVNDGAILKQIKEQMLDRGWRY